MLRSNGQQASCESGDKAAHFCVGGMIPVVWSFINSCVVVDITFVSVAVHEHFGTE